MKKDKLFMIISISLLVICIIGSTYALYRGILSKNLGVNTTTHGLDYYINYVKGSDITSATLNPSTDYTGGSSSDIEFWKKDNTYDIYGKIELTINTIGTNLSSSSALKYSVVNNNEVLSSGSLQGTTAGSKVTVLENLYLETTRQIYTVYIWLDNNEELGDISNESLSISVDCTASMIPTIPAAQKIINLYNDAEKEIVTNNSITYNTAPSVSLMNDRLGGTTEDLDGGNIRYYGASPDNYIYFNCSDYSNQSDSTCEKWRIIGVFDGKVKIIRNSSIGTLAWDQDKNIDSSSTTYDNDWTTSSLQVLLNQKYYNGDTSGLITYYSGSIGNTTTGLNMSSIGIKNDTTRSLISDTTYYLGGESNAASYSNQFYSYERGNEAYTGHQTTWIGKIALPYPSDYGYAADFNSCTLNINNYYNSVCTSVNWMKAILGTGSSGWLLTPYLGYSDYACSIQSAGGLYDDYETFANFGVAPVLYLGSELGIESGTGTSSDPYRLSV